MSSAVKGMKIMRENIDQSRLMKDIINIIGGDENIVDTSGLDRSSIMMPQGEV
jgi:hypothetical protein